MSKHSSSGTEWEKVRAQVLLRDGAVCGYCGRHATTVDHIIPKVRGGTDTMDNLISACKKCNSEKGANVETRNNWYNKDHLAYL